MVNDDSQHYQQYPKSLKKDTSHSVIAGPSHSSQSDLTITLVRSCIFQTCQKPTRRNNHLKRLGAIFLFIDTEKADFHNLQTPNVSFSPQNFAKSQATVQLKVLFQLNTSQKYQERPPYLYTYGRYFSLKCISAPMICLHDCRKYDSFNQPSTRRKLTTNMIFAGSSVNSNRQASPSCKLLSQTKDFQQNLK